MAGRVRQISDALGEFTVAVNGAIPVLRTVDISKLDGRSREVLERFANEVRELNRQLATTNRNLQTLAQRHIMGMLGGGAEAEINRLVARVDALRSVLEEAVRLVR